MYNQVYNHKIGYFDNNKKLKADKKNFKINKNKRKTLKEIKKKIPDLEKILNTSNLCFNNLSKKQKAFLITSAVLLTTVGLASAYHLSKQNKPEIDKYKPMISEPLYTKKISPNKIQNITFTATDIIDSKNTTAPIDNVVLELTYPWGEVVNKTLETNNKFFQFKTKTSEEGKHKIRIIAKDKLNNTEIKESSFDVVDEPPIIKSYCVTPSKINKGETFDLQLKGEDDVGIREVYTEVNFPNASKIDIPMKFNGTHYFSKLRADNKGEHKFNFYVVDTKNQTTRTRPITTSVEYPFFDEYFDWAIENRINSVIAEDVYKWHSDFVEKAYNKDKTAFLEFLKLADRNATDGTPFEKNVANTMANIIDSDYRVPIYLKNDLKISSSKLLNDVGVTGFKRKESIFIPGNYSSSLNYLPRHSNEDILRLINSAEQNPQIIDFSPAITKDKNNVTHVFKSQNIPRDIWLITENLNRYPTIAEKDEYYLALNMMSQQNGYDFFERENMLKYNLKPTDREVWEIVDPLRNWIFNDDRMGFPLDFSWISDTNDKKIAYMKLFEFPNRVADIDEYLENKEIVYLRDLDAMKHTVEWMPKLYEEVSNSYPNGTWNNPYTGVKVPYRNFLYASIADRGYRGFENSMEQFIGSKIVENLFLPDLDERLIEKNPQSTNTFLSKNFSEYKLIKHVHGYGREYGGGDSQSLSLYYPIAFKSFRIPFDLTKYSERYSDIPMGYVSSYDGSIFGLPDNVTEPIEQGTYGESLILPGNGFDFLASSLEGVKKDIYQGQQNPEEPNLKYIDVHLNLRGKKIELFTQGIKG